MTSAWDETTLPTILSQYELGDIYNGDEFGLFYKALPSQSLQLKSEKCTGGKLSKVRVTGLAAAHAVGEKLPMFVIGKSAKPRCFKGSNSYHAGTVAKERVGWTVACLKNGFGI